jgi:hypothetical protein
LYVHINIIGHGSSPVTNWRVLWNPSHWFGWLVFIKKHKRPIKWSWLKLLLCSFQRRESQSHIIMSSCLKPFEAFYPSLILLLRFILKAFLGQKHLKFSDSIYWKLVFIPSFLIYFCHVSIFNILCHLKTCHTSDTSTFEEKKNLSWDQILKRSNF